MVPNNPLSLLNIISAYEFGASPDNEDNTDQLQAAIDYCQDNDIELLLPPVNLKHSGLTITKAISIRGTSRKSILECTDPDLPNIFLDLESSNLVVNLSDFTLYRGLHGIHHSNPLNNPNGPAQYLSRYSQWNNLNVLGASYYGIFLQGSHIGLTHGKWNCEGCRIGLKTQGFDITNGMTLIGFRAAGCSEYGVDLEQTATPGLGDSNTVTFINPIIEGNPGTGFRSFSVSSNWYGGWLENNGLDLRLQTNYEREEGVTYALTNLNGVNWSSANQNTRVSIESYGIRFADHASTGGFGQRNVIDGNNKHFSSSIFLSESRLTVENWNPEKMAELNSNKRSTMGSLTVNGEFIQVEGAG